MPTFLNEQNPSDSQGRNSRHPVGAQAEKGRFLQKSILLTCADGASQAPNSRGAQLQMCLQLKQTCGETVTDSA